MRHIFGLRCLSTFYSVKRLTVGAFYFSMMPEMDGIELKKIIGFNTPVVALTADAVTGAKEKYLNLGFYTYIPKPINIELLKVTIQSIKSN